MSTLTPTYRNSASVIVTTKTDYLSDGFDYSICFVRRSLQTRFMPGALVFPGGVVEPEDTEGGVSVDTILRRCALRELREESGIAYQHIERLIHLCDWETPTDIALSLMPKGGYSTRFFLLVLNEGELPNDGSLKPDGSEVNEMMWVSPQAACTMAIPFTQQHILSYISKCNTFRSLSTHANIISRSVYRYPYKPLYFEDPLKRVCYLLPGDSQHDRYRARIGFHEPVKHRAYMSTVNRKRIM
jgi:8-oxo-dGTP pyrophosphatase MutT (NUDIX family)